MAKKSETFGQKLLRLRLEREWSQQRMAEFIGIKQASVSRLENDEWEPSMPVQRIVETLEQGFAA